MAGPDFIARALSTQAGLLVASAALLLARPGRVPLRITRRGLAWSALGLTALLSINLAASWGMERAREAYLGLPQIPTGVIGMLVVLVGALSAPLAEELFFREALLCRVLGSSPRLFAIVVSSLLFGALHLGVGGPVLFVGLSAMGLALAVVRVRSGSLGAAILAHAANNLVAFLLAAGQDT